MNQDSLETQQLYDTQSNKYTKNQSTNLAVLNVRKLVYKLAGSLRGSRVLFAGCGDGDECRDAVSQGAQVEGIDISGKNIEKAIAHSFSGANFQTMDILDLSFPKGEFDLVISILAVMYIEDIDKALAGFKQVMKDSGRIILVVPHPLIKMMKYNSKENYFLKGKQRETWNGIDRFNYYRLFEDYVDSFTKVGLVINKLLEPEPELSSAEAATETIKYPHFVVFELTKNTTKNT